MQALLIAPDPTEHAMLAVVLQEAGLQGTTAPNLAQALERWSERPADLIMIAVDTEPPRDIVRTIRGVAVVPLVLITDTLNEGEHVDLLKAGADLVVERPYSSRVLVSQIQSVARGGGSMPLASLPPFGAGALTIDPSTRTVEIADRGSYQLTQLEFRLLYTLMVHRKKVIPADTLVEYVWGYTGTGDRNMLRRLVNRLRAKVESDPRHPQYVRTVSGIGYTFVQG